MLFNEGKAYWNTFKPIVEKLENVKCPKCGGDIVARRTHNRGKEFFGCTNYPECDFISWSRPTTEKCPKCGSLFVKKALKNGENIVCSKCGYKKEVAESAE